MITTLQRGGTAKWLQYYIGGGYAQMITILHGGGSLGTPKSDYIIWHDPLLVLCTLQVLCVFCVLHVLRVLHALHALLVSLVLLDYLKILNLKKKHHPLHWLTDPNEIETKCLRTVRICFKIWQYRKEVHSRAMSGTQIFSRSSNCFSDNKQTWIMWRGRSSRRQGVQWVSEKKNQPWGCNTFSLCSQTDQVGPVPWPMKIFWAQSCLT